MIATRFEKKERDFQKKGKRPFLNFGIEWLFFLVIF